MSFFKSEIMRSYYRTAKNKGWVKDDPEIVRTASEKSLKATGNLLVDLCALATALRKKGYESQANDLENKISAYKKAETHLYRVHDEDGPDVLEFAHPDGDFTISDSECGYGDVETELSSHKKIIDIINKQPTGKRASLNKEAQQTYPKTYPIIEFLSEIKPSLSEKDIIQAFEKNSGPLYNFLNLYYHDFFKEMYNYYSAAMTVYGNAKNRNHTYIEVYLSNQGADYLNRVGSVGINVYDLYGSFKETDDKILGGFSNIAQEIDRRFKQKYSNVNNKINSVVNNATQSVREIINKLKSLSRNPNSFLDYLNNLQNNDKLTYLQHLVGGLVDPDYVQGLTTAYEKSKEMAKYIAAKLLKKQKERDSITRLQHHKRYLAHAVDKFNKASEMFDEYDSKNPESTGFDENAAIAASLAGAVADYDGNIESLKQSIRNVIDHDVQSMSEIRDLANKWLSAAMQLTGKNKTPQRTETVSFEDLPEA